MNKALPLPESLRMFEQTQLELIRSVLEGGLGVSFNLAMLALVPGICEELLFRGYAQRQFERAVGPAGGVLLSGVLFGAYHLRPSQLLPLVVLGVYLAYLTWRTGSLWPAVAAHNGLAVLAARYARQHPEYDLQALETATMPWYAVGLGFVIVGGVLYVLHVQARPEAPQ
jgi:membrane protease YdiL (CAAX protease family)